MIEEHGIGTYSVGVLWAIQRSWKTHTLSPLKIEWNYLVYQAHRKDWRAIKSAFNGYLAEWHFPPEGVYHNKCGHGWTRRRARRRLGKYLVANNLSWQECTL